MGDVQFFIMYTMEYKKMEIRRNKMRLLGDKVVTSDNLKKANISIPKSIYGTNIFGKDLEVEPCYCANNNTLSELWNNQHPLIHTWLILTSVSICFLSALLFIIQ